MKPGSPPLKDGGFDAHAEFLKILEDAKASRRRNFKQSKLDPYTSQLLGLAAEGALPSHMRRWLRKAHRIDVSESTVRRWLAKHPR